MPRTVLHRKQAAQLASNQSRFKCHCASWWYSRTKS